MLKIDVQDGASDRLRALVARVTRRLPLMEEMGREARNVLHEHFRSRPPNKKGWPSQGFWGDVADQTSFQGATETDATVKIADPRFNQKFYGGTINAPPGKYLAIPLTARAYAAGRPRNWGGSGSLMFIRTAKAAVLIERLHSMVTRGGKRQRGTGIEGGEAQYLLIKRVTQRRDERALPSDLRLRARLRRRASLYIERVITRGGTP